MQTQSAGKHRQVEDSWSVFNCLVLGMILDATLLYKLTSVDLILACERTLLLLRFFL